jgi:hypothetical protein
MRLAGAIATIAAVWLLAAIIADVSPLEIKDLILNPEDPAHKYLYWYSFLITNVFVIFHTVGAIKDTR